MIDLRAGVLGLSEQRRRSLLGFDEVTRGALLGLGEDLSAALLCFGGDPARLFVGRTYDGRTLSTKGGREGRLIEDRVRRGSLGLAQLVLELSLIHI